MCLFIYPHFPINSTVDVQRGSRFQPKIYLKIDFAQKLIPRRKQTYFPEEKSCNQRIQIIYLLKITFDIILSYI